MLDIVYHKAVKRRWWIIDNYCLSVSFWQDTFSHITSLLRSSCCLAWVLRGCILTSQDKACHQRRPERDSSKCTVGSVPRGSQDKGNFRGALRIAGSGPQRACARTELECQRHAYLCPKLYHYNGLLCCASFFCFSVMWNELSWCVFFTNYNIYQRQFHCSNIIFFYLYLRRQLKSNK